MIALDFERRFLMLENLANDQCQRAFSGLELIALMLQLFDARQNFLQFRRIALELETELMCLHHDVAAAGEIADKHTSRVTHCCWIDVLITSRELLNGIYVLAAFVRESRGAYPWQTWVLSYVRVFINDM